MNEHEIQRIAAAMHVARPDWPASSVATLIRKKLGDRPRRDVFVALAWVASEPNSATPARVLESGPWWRAAGVESSTAHHHIAKVYGSTEGDPREVCSECGMHRHECERRAGTNGHTFVSRIDAQKPHEHDEGCIDFCRRAGLLTDDNHAAADELRDNTSAEEATDA